MSKFDGMWGREIREQAAREQNKRAATSPIATPQQVAQKLASFSSVAFRDNELAVREQLAASITTALEAERERSDRLSDSQYIAGMHFGWNCCEAGNHELFNQAAEGRFRERAAAIAAEGGQDDPAA